MKQARQPKTPKKVRRGLQHRPREPRWAHGQKKHVFCVCPWRSHQDSVRWPKMAPSRLRIGRDDPKTATGWPKTAHDNPKTDPKTAPRQSKMTPRRAKSGPRWTKTAPGWAKTAPRRAKTAPRHPKKGPRRLQDRPEESRWAHTKNIVFLCAPMWAAKIA